MQRDIANKLSPKVGLAPVETQSANVNGLSFDKVANPGFESVMHVVNVGDAGDTWDGANYVDLVLQESDDDSVWNDVANDDMETYDPADKGTDGEGIFKRLDDSATDDEQAYHVGYKGNKRYSRVRLEFTGTHSTGSPFSAMAVAGHALARPVD